MSSSLGSYFPRYHRFFFFPTPSIFFCQKSEVLLGLFIESVNQEKQSIKVDIKTAVAATPGEQIRDHAPVRDIRWKAIDFGIRESIVVRVGQTFDIGNYKNDMEARETIDLKCQDLYKEWKSNLCTRYFAMKNKVADPKNHAPYSCKLEDWVFMIDNVWETKDWKLKEKRKKQNIAEKFEMAHRRHRHGGEWINDKAREHHAKLKAKLKEQSQPNVTNPSSERQISVDVLGKRSVYVKEYGSHMSTISSFNQPQEPDPEAALLQKKVFAVKAGVDPAQVQEVIDGCNSEAGTSDEEADAMGNSDELNTLDEEDDEASISVMLVLYLAMGVRLFRLACSQVVQAVVLSQLLEGSNMWEVIPRTLCGVDDALVRQGNAMESLNVF
ncbi:hypothetical protein RHSIM_Rhsim01G0102200 [Rhododendron simsii]|uniref:Transposase n=1 Tax=Rhododendron simsii TaxID=118357 RepID=A0A834HGW5_RHOSS|nr:hypothetical protein RHSIM_Rhsim01G0102200 [Rhododendron simsii]